MLEQFKNFLFSQEVKPSKVTVKNYLSDINHFIRWYELHCNQTFEPKSVTHQTIEQYKEENTLSPRSMERHLSSLRKFFTFLKLEGKISHNPFEEPRTKNQELNADPFRLKGFKSYLYVFNASHLTIKNYLIDIKQFLNWAKEVLGLNDSYDLSANNLFEHISGNLLEEYKQRLVSLGTFSPATINRKLSSLRKYTSWLEAEGLIGNLELNRPLEVRSAKLDLESLKSRTQDVNPSTDGSSSRNSHVQPQGFGKPEYSGFPPLRLLQKVTKGVNLAVDATLITQLVKIIEKAEILLWKTKGMPVFVRRFTPIKNLRISADFNPRKSVSNIKKELYAPLEISTKYFPWYKKAWFSLRYKRPNWYKTYHSYAIVHYFHFAVLVIFAAGLVFGFYTAFVGQEKTPTLAANVPTNPNRILNFQGRLTDASDNPITSATNLRFSIYTQMQPGTGSAILLWQEVNQVAPDTDGIFNTLLGNTATVCANPLTPASGRCSIPSTLFSENNALFLGVTVEATPELTPRQQLATVAFASNSETLQGLLPITATAAGTTNVVLALNSSGNLVIGGSATPIFQASGGQLTLAGQTLVLNTNSTSNGNIQLAPDGTGKIDLTKPLQNTSISNNISTAVGSVEIDDLLSILATSSGQSALTINQTGAGPLISASASGANRFAIDNSGNVRLAGGQTSDIDIFASATLAIGTLNQSGLTIGRTSTANTTIQGANFVNGGVLYGLSGSVSITGAGGTNQCLLGQGSGVAPIFGNCATGVSTDLYWNQQNGSLFPNNSTVDFFVGGQSTTSAKFAITGVASGTPIATLSASTNGNGVVLSAATSTIQSLRNNGLIIGGDTSGDIQFKPGNSSGSLYLSSNGRVGIGITNPSAILHISGSGNSNVANGPLLITDPSGSLNYTVAIGYDSSNSVGYINVAYLGSSFRKLVLQAGGGQVGIGTITPVNALDIKGGLAVGSYAGVNAAPTNGLVVSGNVGIGTTAPLVTFDVRGSSGTLAVASVSGNTSFAALVANNDGVGDLFTASSSGTNKFAVKQNGTLLAPTYSTCTLKTDSNGLFTCGVDNNTGVNWWNQLAGALSPIDTTNDFLLGATATASADFAITGIGLSTNQVNASLSGQLIVMSNNGWGGNATISGALTLGAFSNGVIQTTNNRSLTLGGNTTGDIILSPNNGTNGLVTISGSSALTTGTGLTTIGGNLTVNGATTTFNNASATLTTGTNQNLTINPNGSGVLNLNTAGTGATNLGTSTNTGTVTIGNATGDLTLGVDTITASSLATFTTAATLGISATTLNLGNSSAATIATVLDDNLTITAAGSGDLILSSDFDTPVLIGSSTNTPAILSISGGIANNAALIVNNLNNGDLIAASASGVTKFRLDNSGNASMSGSLTMIGANSIQTTSFQTLTLGGSTTGQVVLSGFNGAVNGITMSGYNTCTLKTGSTGVVTCGTDLNTGVNWWNQLAGLLSPIDINNDFAVGGTSTASAKFSYTGIQSGQTIASISGQLLVYPNNGYGGNASISAGLVLGANSLPTIQTTKNQLLTIGGNTTGNITLSPNNGTAGLVSISGSSLFTTGTGAVSLNGATTVANGITFTANGVVNLGDNGDNVVIDSNTWDVTGAGVASGLTGLSSSGTITFSTLNTNGGVLYTNGSGTLAQVAGTSSQCLIGGTPPTFGPCNTGVTTDLYWNQNLGALFPNNSTLDFLFGSQASVSARFKLTANNFGAGTLAVASISGKTSFASLVVNNDGIGDLFTASASGWTRFRVANSGAITSSAYTTGGGIIYATSNGLFSQTTAGVSNECLKSTGGSTPTWGTCGSGGGSYSPFQELAGAIVPNNSTMDLLIGGQATTSAKFAFVNVNSGTPTLKIFDSTKTYSLNLSHDGTNANILSTTGTVNIGQGGGTLYVQTDIQNDSTNNLGAIQITDRLNVLPAATSNINSNAALIVNNPGTGDILTASAGGTTRFTINNAGAVGVTSGYGSANQCLTSNGSGTAASWGACGSGGGGAFTELLGAIVPLNSTEDFMIGSQATASADFAITGISNPNSQVNASLSGQLIVMANNGWGGNATISGALTLGAFSLPVIQTTKNQGLTIGGNTTGNIIFSPNNTQTLVMSPNRLSLTGTTTVDSTGALSLNTVNNQTITTGTGLFSTGGVLQINGTTGTAINISNTGITTDLSLQNGETIDNDTDNTIKLTYGAAGGILNLTSTTNSVINASARLDLQADGAVDVNIAGGSGTTGCTILNASGNLSCSGTITSTATTGVQGWWNVASGSLFPTNSTLDFLIGGQSTASADFAITGLSNPNSQVNASLSGQLIVMANNGWGGNATISGALTLGAFSLPVIQTTKNQGLTIGGNTTGNITLSPLNGASGSNLIVNALTTTLSGTTALTASSLATFTTAATLTLSGTTALTASGLTTITSSTALSLNPNTGTSYTLDTSATTLALFGTPNVSITIGNAAPILNIGPGSTTATSINLAGGSGATGCTVDGATGNLTCSGNILTTATTGLQGWWNVASGSLFPTNSTLDLLIGGQSSASAKFRVTGASAFAGTLSVASISGRTSFATLVVDNSGAGDLITASASGVTQFKMSNAGRIDARSYYDLDNPSYFLDPAATATSLDVLGGIAVGTTTPLSQTGLHINKNTLGNTAVIINQLGSGDLITGSASGTTNFLVKNNGDVVVGNGGTGKITVTTIDPLYTIDGTRYSTYAPSMTGVKEEVTGKAALSYNQTRQAYSYTINLNGQENGSDLWLFSRVIDTDVGLTSVLLTPDSSAKVWYEKDTATRSITFFADRKTSLSYRLTAPRFDHEKWQNLSDETDSNITGLIAPPAPDSSSTLAALLNNASASGNLTSNEVTIGETLDQSGNTTYSLVDSFGNAIKIFQSFSDILVANIQAGAINAKEITTNALNITTENITVNGQSLRNYIVAIVSDTISTLASQGQALRSYGDIISPIASIDEIHTDLISPLAQDSNISVSLDDSKFIIHDSKYATGSAVASIDNAGNATFSGQISANQAEISGNLTAGDASISGTLRAQRIIADQIEGLNIQAATISANYITNNYYASTSNVVATASSEQGIASSFPTLSASPSGTNPYTLNANNYISVAPFASEFAYVENLSAATASFNQGLMVFGPTTLSDTSVVGQLSVNGSLILADNSINVLGSDLNLQPLRQGGLSIMAGLIYIDTNGNATFEKDVTVKGTLYANAISPIPGNDLTLRLGNQESGITNHDSQFIIHNSTGSGVLAINSLGDLIASGTATFSKLNLGLVSPALALSPTEVIATGSAGTGSINAGRTQMTINNKLVTDKSLIYITPTTNTNQTLFLLRQVPGDSFTVGIQNPGLTPIQFNWIIVN